MRKPSQRRTRPSEDAVTVARAFADASRDILAADGVLMLADPEHRGRMWRFDGHTWRRLTLPAQRRQARAELPRLAEPQRAAAE